MKFTRLPLLICFVATVAIIAACGKYGPPQPQDPKRNFSFAATQANVSGNCLNFITQVEGAHQNIDRIRLELSPVNFDEDCPTCPFSADEVVYFMPSETKMDASNGELTFSYCPKPAKGYRWRILGVSRFSTVPHAATFAQYTEMVSE